jgi:acetate---CoA ligase (ADP-forming)
VRQKPLSGGDSPKTRSRLDVCLYRRRETLGPVAYAWQSALIVENGMPFGAWNWRLRAPGQVRRWFWRQYSVDVSPPLEKALPRCASARSRVSKSERKGPLPLGPSLRALHYGCVRSAPIAGTQGVLLADGSTALVRAAQPEDREHILDLHRRLSQESVILRFFGIHHLTEAEVTSLTHADGIDRVVLVAERADVIIGLAQYIRVDATEDAEVAFEVEDCFQGHGVGTLLLEHLAAAARKNGIRRFVAQTLCENSKMLRVFHSAGFASRYRRDSEVMHVALDITPSIEALAKANERDKLAVVESMRRLLEPHSIAVVGASRAVGTIGNAIVQNLIRNGFAGPVFPVNPNARHISGIPCWPSIEAITEEVDLAVIAVPADIVVDTVRQCGKKGVGGLVVVTDGFAELGRDGLDTQQSLVRTAHEYGMRLIGPNCLGVVNTDPEVSMNATFATSAPERGRVAFASQSGGLGISVLAESLERGLGLSNFVSMGNKADVSGNDLITWWGEDDNTDVILLYLESLGNPQKFARIARQVSHSKPIVVLKGGRSGVGARAALSHTAAIASSENSVDALFCLSGVIRVDTVEELFDVAEVLADQRIPAGPRVAIVGNAGGPCVLAADACVGHGLVVPQLSQHVQAALGEFAASGAGLSNPVDLVDSASPETFRRTLQCIEDSGEVDSIIVVFAPPIGTSAEEIADVLRESVDDRLPIVGCILGDAGSRRRLVAGPHPVPCFAYPESAARALARGAEYGLWRASEATEDDHEVEIASNLARLLIADSADFDGWVTGAAALEVLAACGIPTTPTTVVHDGIGASIAARDLNAPVVIKAVGKGLLHNRGAAGVALNVRPADARSTFERMAEALPAMTEAIVQPMVGSGVELIVGGVRDPAFGAQLFVGLGGIAVEVLGDHQTRIAPVSPRQASQMLTELKSYPLLNGWRETAPCNKDAIVNIIVRIGRLLSNLPEIAEIDCDPLICGPSGASVVECSLRILPAPSGTACKETYGSSLTLRSPEYCEGNNNIVPV